MWTPTQSSRCMPYTTQDIYSIYSPRHPCHSCTYIHTHPACFTHSATPHSNLAMMHAHMHAHTDTDTLACANTHASVFHTNTLHTCTSSYLEKFHMCGIIGAHVEALEKWFKDALGQTTQHITSLITNLV